MIVVWRRLSTSVLKDLQLRPLSSLSSSQPPPRTPSSSSQYLDLSELDARVRSIVQRDLVIIPEFLSEHEHSILSQQTARKLRLLGGPRYHEQHFDKVIKGYRECEVSSWGAAPNRNLDIDSDTIMNILSRARDTAESFLFHKDDEADQLQLPAIEWLQPHLLDLREQESGIDKHIDDLNASGRIIAGLCLKSDAVMKFEHMVDTSLSFVALLPARCLYIQK